MIVLRFDRGRVLVEGAELTLHGLTPRTEFPAYMYPDIITHLAKQKTEYRDEANQRKSLDVHATGIELRDYQQQAVQEWRKNSGRGVVVLPTGAGKTFVAVKAIESLQKATLVVVPTIVLLEQWRQVLEEALNVPVGAVGGGNQEIREITVSTYDSASIRSRILGNQFEFIVFDEVHHLTAPSYMKIATRYIAPYRLGLTATLQQGEEAEELFTELVGPTVYSLPVERLAGTHLADFTVKTMKLPLTRDESEEYDRLYGVYRSYIQRKNIRIRSSQDYIRFVRSTGRNPEARRALVSRNAAMDIALNSENKVAYLKSLIRSNPGEKMLIFTSHNKLVYRLSKTLLIPAITHRTPPEERDRILRGFKKGSFRRIVTSRVLDEGVDVPDASVGVIISGTGSKRQFIQRLGRILRKTPGKQAVLYELVSEGTAETYMSARRKAP